MKEHDALNQLMHQLQEYKKKFYLNMLLRGSIFAIGMLISIYVVYSLLEYMFYFPQYVRGFLLFSFIGLVLYVFFRWIALPISALANLKKVLTDEQAAQQVGTYYPEIKDKLLNAIQLQNLDKTNDLIAASINQRSGQLLKFRFTEAVKFKENKSLLKYAALPAGIALLIALVYPTIFVQGTERIIHYKKFYAPVAPFTFEVQNDQLQTYRGEDFELKLAIEGKSIPSEVFLHYNGRRQKLTRNSSGLYTYTFKQLQKPVNFRMEGSGFYSEDYNLRLLSRPNLKDFEMQIAYPDYLNRKTETIKNTGNATIPEGSTLTWNFAATETDSIRLTFQEPAQTIAAKQEGNVFKADKKFDKSQAYSIKLQNAHSSNKEDISYQINTIPDKHPQISIEQFQDTALYNFLVVGGDVSDDYGLTALQLHYRINNEKTAPDAKFKSRALPLNKNQLSQTYYYQWNTANLSLQPGDRIEYFVQVWDNDGLRGRKSARTRTFEMKVPTKKELEKELASNAQSVQSQISKSLEKSTQLNQELNKTEEKLKTKREMSWQDKKLLEDLVAKKKQLEQDISSMKDLYDQLNQKQNMHSEQNKQLAEKAEELKKLMNDLLDDETKKLYEELEKLLQQQKPNDPELQKLLSKLDNRERNLEKELERALELFKQLQFEQKLDNIANQLDKLGKEQQELAKETEDKTAKNEKLQEEQKEIAQNFEDLKKQLEELSDLNKELEHPNQMEDLKQDEQQIEQDMQQSQEQLQKQQNKNASESQQKAGQKMQEMAQKMEEMQESMSMESMSENLDNLRDILENLIKLSFDQEDVMKSFRGVNQRDPRFISLSQQQLNLRDNAKVIEDSLYSLAKKVFQLQSFVTREVAQMNQGMDNTMKELRDRNIGKATAQQQLAMTSMNNLALMLNDALTQMQQQMQQQMPGNQAGKKKGNKPQPGDIGQMQDQLNKKIEDLKKGGKSGKALSEELAKLAAEQEALRNALKEMEQMGKKPGENGKDGDMGNISKMMEQTEADLVNKRLTEQTIMRQREILTRLLQAENSMKERELDNKREAKTAQDIPKKLPESFEKYLRAKEKQTEVLKTVPPSLSPYYKQKVNEYFQNSIN
ncbi:DUF4175 family protein [Pontibacter beigongshangensis]|uniref:DUF4175 family protein n=1 Tax=Pontibacter beigongshangensis TaxID=2574733 RepID=UPI00164F839E|nr:DUF4175 family protein [Pontibacter beigongshangensis]